jgi:WD40 repeat protein
VVIVSVAFSPDGFRLAGGGMDGSARMWSLRDRDSQPIILQKSQTSRVTLGSVAFSPDGMSLASGSRNMQVWNLAKPESPPLVLEGGPTDYSLNFGFASVTFSSDSARLSAGSSKRAWVWNLQRPQDKPLDLRIPGNVLAVAFSSESSDGTRLAVGSDESAQLWELQNPRSQPYLFHQANSSRSMAFSKDGWQLFVAAFRNLQVWNLHDPNSAAGSLPVPTGVMSVALSKDGLRLATGELNGTIRVWNMQDLEAPPVSLLRPDSEQYVLGMRWGISSLAFSTDATRLTFADYSNRVGFWDLLHPGAPPHLLLTHDAERMALSADGLRLASVEKNHDVLVWDLRKPEAPPIRFENSGGVASMAFSLDGTHLALGGAFDYKVTRVFDLLQPDRPPLMLHDSINALATALSNDGTRLAIADEANEVHVWDLRTPSPTVVLFLGPAQNNALGGMITFSPDGLRIASSNGSGDITVWDLWSRAADDICARVWRNLTLDEWRFYVGDDFPYERTCPSLPPGPGVPN